MKKCSGCKKQKDENEFSVCKAHSDSLASNCKPCAAAYGKTWRADNAEKIRADKKTYRQNNLVHARNKAKLWKRDNAEKVKLLRQPYLDRTVEKRRAQAAINEIKNKESNLIRHRQHKKDNPARYASMCRLRQARKLQATPVWADVGMIRAFYELSAFCTELTGEQHHVDHVIPLQGKLVCGLHVHNNLQVITENENLMKGRKYGA